MTTERTPRTATGRKVVAIHGAALLDDVLGIEDESATPAVTEDGGTVILPGDRDFSEWVDEAMSALDRGGFVDWDDSRHAAEAVAAKLWNYLLDGLIRHPAATPAVTEDGLGAALIASIEGMKACAPDGDYIRWDVEHADPTLHYVNRQGVLDRLRTALDTEEATPPADRTGEDEG